VLKKKKKKEREDFFFCKPLGGRQRGM